MRFPLLNFLSLPVLLFALTIPGTGYSQLCEYPVTIESITTTDVLSHGCANGTVTVIATETSGGSGATLTISLFFQDGSSAHQGVASGQPAIFYVMAGYIDIMIVGMDSDESCIVTSSVVVNEPPCPVYSLTTTPENPVHCESGSVEILAVTTSDQPVSYFIMGENGYYYYDQLIPGIPELVILYASNYTISFTDPCIACYQEFQFSIDISSELSELYCEPEIHVTSEPGFCGAFVDIEYPVDENNCAIGSVYNDYNFTNSASDTYPVGETILTWIAYDYFENEYSCSTIITVEDIEAPQISCTDEITVPVSEGTCEAYVNVALPFADDNCEVYSLINDYNLGEDASDWYNVGSNIVTWTAEDVNGITSQCVTTIIVVDDELPVVTCGTISEIVAEEGICEAWVEVPVTTASDNCGVEDLVNDFSGTMNATGMYPVGTTLVTWTATDIHGNVSTCIIDVTVLDVEAPEIICPANVVQSPDAGSCDATVNPGLPAISDNCSDLSFINDFTGTDNGSGVYPKGITDITWTVTDLSGNEATCIQQVEVLSLEEIELICTADKQVSAPYPSCEVFVNVAAPVIMYNCEISSVVNDYNGGMNANDFYNDGLTTVTWTVTDVYGSSATCSTDILVICDTPDPCPEDMNNDGAINTSDLLLFTSEYGCSGSCGPADINNDSSVNVTDMLLFLAAFGTLCN